MNPHNLNFNLSHTWFVHLFLFFVVGHSAVGVGRSSWESEEAIELGVSLTEEAIELGVRADITELNGTKRN